MSDATPAASGPARERAVLRSVSRAAAVGRAVLDGAAVAGPESTIGTAAAEAAARLGGAR